MSDSEELMDEFQEELFEDDEIEEEQSDYSSNTEDSQVEEAAPLGKNQVYLVEAILCDNNHKELKRYLLCGLGEESNHLLKVQHKAIFPLKFFDESQTLQQMELKLQEALSDGSLRYHWRNSTKAADLAYVSYKKTPGYGCKHYVTMCQFQCQCGKWCGCPYCHEASFSLTDSLHDFKPTQIKCLNCELEQPFQQTCTGCQKKMFEFGCQKCGFSSMNVGFFHCPQCDKCIEGLQQQFVHCAKCNSCYHEATNHEALCGQADADVCQICQSEFDQMYLKRFRLCCGHDLHHSCLQNLQQNDKDRKCPTCRMPAQTRTENQAEYQKFISLYAMTEIPQYKLGNYVQIECLKCKQAQVKHWHPKGYICYKCGSVNCQETGKFEDAVEGAKLVQEQYKEIRERGEIPIYPLVLFPKEGYEEMAEMIEDYVQKYKEFWIEARTRVTSPFEMPLREMVNAYCLVRDIDDHIGFAGLNLCHVRKFFPPEEKLIELAYECARSMQEVKEVRRLRLDE